MNEVKCPSCEISISFRKRTKVLGGNSMICNDCGHTMSVAEFNSLAFSDTHQTFVKPKCPNSECENHTNPPLPKDAFVINVLEQGLLGKVFKSESVNMISCVKCGHIIGVAGKG